MTNQPFSIDPVQSAIVCYPKQAAILTGYNDLCFQTFYSLDYSINSPRVKQPLGSDLVLPLHLSRPQNAC